MENKNPVTGPRIGRLLFIAAVIVIVFIDGTITVYMGHEWRITAIGVAPIVTVIDLIVGNTDAPPLVTGLGLAGWLLPFALRWRSIGLNWSSLSLAFLPFVNLIMAATIPPGFRHTKYFDIAGKAFFLLGVTGLLFVGFLSHHQ